MARGDKYEVGYAQPPRAQQFGQSTRVPRKKVPRKSKHLSDLNNAVAEYAKVLGMKRIITVDGEDVESSLFELVIRSIRARAINGDVRAHRQIEEVCKSFLPQATQVADYTKNIERFLNLVDKSQIQKFLKRSNILRCVG